MFPESSQNEQTFETLVLKVLRPAYNDLTT